MASEPTERDTTAAREDVPVAAVVDVTEPDGAPVDEAVAAVVVPVPVVDEGPRFDAFSFPKPLRAALAQKGFERPTDVQRMVLDPALAGRDLLVSSRTGSGKTVAFGLAASTSLVKGDAILTTPKERGAPKMLVIAPTRELAQQVEAELRWLFGTLGARVTSCVGGTDPMRERRVLAAGVHVVVGTPGRLVDHVERKALDLSGVDVVVLDEADEMLDMGFQEDLEFLLAAANPNRRTLLFSATLPPPIVKLASTYQKDAARVQASPASRAHQDIQILMHPVAPREREHAVVNVLRFHDAQTAIVFVGMRETVTRLHAALVDRGFAAVALSGELSQAERNRALQAVRDGRARVLVCTDVAARGLDLPEVSLVIHADVAENAVALTHRNGRTGRAGKKGTAVILATSGSRFSAERQLFSLQVKPHWTPLPTPEQVSARDRARSLDTLKEAAAALAVDVDSDTAELASALAERFSPQDLALLVAKAERSRLPAPEDVDDSVALATMAARKQQGHHHQPAPAGPAPGGGLGPPRGDGRGPPRGGKPFRRPHHKGPGQGPPGRSGPGAPMGKPPRR